MKKNRWVLVIVLITVPLFLFSSEQESEKEGIFGTGRISESWSRMNTVEKCFAAIVIPPGYVVGVCCKSIAWLFMGQREF